MKIGKGVTYIGDSAFYNCYLLETVYLPLSLTTIDDWAFLNCNSLSYVYYEGSLNDLSRISIGSLNYAISYANIFYNYPY